MNAIEAPKLPRNLEMHRALRIARTAADAQGLNLSGLTVLTEAATGPYAGTACIAALRGADVIAVARDGRWADAETAARATREMAQAWGVADRISFVFEKREEDLARADIVVNSGNVRPLDASTVSLLKETAVIPLMWETFEWRSEELDLPFCRQRGILVMGTDENGFDFMPFAAESIIRQLHACGVCVHHSHLLGLGGGIILEITLECLRRAGADARLHGPEAHMQGPGRIPYVRSGAELEDFLPLCDAVICDERQEHALLLGGNGLIDPMRLAELNPSCVVINRHGEMDAERTEASGLHCFPTARTASWQTPHMTTAILGLRPVLELMAAGLRVGEVMARARLAGHDVISAARLAMRESHAQDFPPPMNLLPIP